MRLIFKSTLYFLVLATAVLQAQITGTVIDQNTNLPIEYATITLEQEEQILEGTVSAQNGSFLLPVSNSGEFSIKVSFLGYEPFIVSDLKIQTKSPLDLGRIFLQPGQNFLDEIVLNAESNAFQNKIDRKVYAAGEFSTARGGTGMDIIRNLPSVTVNGLGEISVRGSTGFVVLLNNKPVQSDIQQLLSQIPANSIKNIEIITAPSAQYDAEGKAGIINVLTLKNVLQGDYFQFNTLLGAPSIENYKNAMPSQR
ncbi:MAG: carboxypeptidase-like regulatory domain-containing protein, partial [Bacteroidetes bacterium]|nr:carboxypeptidase-like regulatory domain-containing protein [Bacteroidota bacterium]